MLKKKKIYFKFLIYDLDHRSLYVIFISVLHTSTTDTFFILSKLRFVCFVPENTGSNFSRFVLLFANHWLIRLISVNLEKRRNSRIRVRVGIKNFKIKKEGDSISI